MKRVFFLFPLSLVVTANALAQERVNVSQSCPSQKKAIEDEVYSFPSNRDAKEVVLRIMKVAGVPANFTLFAANVTRVLAVIHGEDRLVLYNTYYVEKALRDGRTPAETLALFAHAIAHHLKGHTFTKKNADKEEKEADEFSGFILAHLGVAGPEAQTALSVAGFSSWRSTIDKLDCGEGNTFDEASALEIPSFRWPPPKASARARLPIAKVLRGRKSATYSTLATSLENAFNAAGYGDVSYFAVPEGFAMVARLEQIREDGTPLAAPARWSTRVRPFVRFSLSRYLRALFMATPGRFRVIVFVVTPRAFSQSARGIGRDEAEAWLALGLDSLPMSIGKRLVRDVKCTALIYEFFKATRDDDAVFKDPSELTGITHLRASKLWSELRL